MLVRQLAYLAALARERHFARAAAACNITQPALSTAIKQLEEELGVPLVERDKRFKGFTPEGQEVLLWARRILSDYDSLRQGIQNAKRGLIGNLRIGVIPSALPLVPHVTDPFNDRHPQVKVTVWSTSSIEIQQGLDHFELEAGITYLDNEPLNGVLQRPLYTERYVLLTSETSDKKIDPEEDAIRLTTVHQAKGLEYGAVFLIGLADGMFPLRRAIEDGDLEEERRLFYVAVTRAKDELYLLYPRIGGKGGPSIMLTPSTFVQELEPHLYEEVRIRRPSWSSNNW